MKKLFLLLAFASLSMSEVSYAGIINPPLSIDPTVKSASPTFMIGIAVEFGDTVKEPEVGFTAKVISSNRPDTFTIGGGLSYFPWSKDQLGADIGVGYNFNHVGTLAGYDFLRSKPQLSIGYIPTEKELECTNPLYPDLIDGVCYGLR